MPHKIYLDTNVIVDIIDRARLNHPEAKKLVSKLVKDDYKVYFSEDIISTIYYILRGNEAVLHFFKNAIQEWSVVPFGLDTINKSIEFSLKYKTDLEDTLQCFCAKANGCNIFLTNDKKFIDCGINILTYDKFL